MEPENGDVYLRRLASWIRENERALAEAGVPRRRPSQRGRQPPDSLSYLNPLSWLGYDPSAGAPKPVVLTTDTHHLFYVLMRLEALDYPVGTLDVHIDNPSRPMTYVNFFVQPDKSDTLSLASFRSSFSAVSKLSLGGGWWSRTERPTIDVDLKFIYSSFTKLPALIIHAPTKAAIEELLQDPPGQNAIPLDSFKNLSNLQCIDIDPRTLLGWDRLAESLRSLTIKKSGLEDVSDIFIGAVVDDQARREGSASRKRQRRIPSRSGYSTPLRDSVIEEEPSEDKPDAGSTSDTRASPPPKLNSLKWAFLKHLSLADNSLTFIPADALSHLTSLMHLDLSSNLLVSVPPALGMLYNLVSLNLSDNMIDSVLGIYLNLGQILYLNLSHNRLESLCGLERLHALERVDLRHNLLDESSEVGRLATLPNITQLWIEGNPFVDFEEQYRIACFNYFISEGKEVILDGMPPSFYERRSLSAPPMESPPSRPRAIAHSPPVVAIGSIPKSLLRTPPTGPVEGLPTPPSSNPSPLMQPQGPSKKSEKKKRKQQKRIVEFGYEGHSAEGSAGSKLLHPDDAAADKSRGRSKSSKKDGKATSRHEDNSITPTPSTSTINPPPTQRLSSTPPPMISGEPKPFRARHSRGQSEYHSPTSMDDEPAPIPRFSPRGSNSRSATLAGKSATRRARMSASMWEPGSPRQEEDGAEAAVDSADEYRRRIEALKQDMGDGWLKVFSQSEIRSPSS